MLAGTLDDVPLRDVLNLLAGGSRSGAVHVVGEGRRGRVDLDAGQIVMAQSALGRLGLLRRLVGMGAVPASAVGDHAHAEGDDPDVVATVALRDAGAIDLDVLDTALTDHIQDAMFDLMRVEHGRFRFDQMAVVAPGPSLAVADVLAEVDSRLEHWAQIHELVPAPGAIVTLVPDPGAERFEVEAAEWRMLALVDGRRTVRELIELTGQGEFIASGALAALRDRGLIELNVAKVDSPSAAAALLAGHREIRSVEADLLRARAEAADRSVPSGGSRESLDDALESDDHMDMDNAPFEMEPESAVAEPSEAETPVAEAAVAEHVADADDDEEPEPFTDAGEDDEPGHDDEPAIFTLGGDDDEPPTSPGDDWADDEPESIVIASEPATIQHDPDDLARRLLEGVGKG